MKRLKGITILDTVIGMVLTGLVAGFAATFYTGLTQTLISFTSSAKESSAYEELFFILNDDIIGHDYVIRTTEGIMCRNESGLLPVDYFLTGRNVIRHQGEVHADTIDIIIKSQEFFFQNEPAPVGQLIDKIQLELKTKRTESLFEWNKKYSSALLWRNRDHGN